jgi:hypothetical protein
MLLPLLSLLPSLSSPLSLWSHCLLHPLLPPPPITASTSSPQSFAAALPSSIAAAIKRCLHCPPCLPSLSVITTGRYQHPLLLPTVATVKPHLCRCHLANTIKCHQILSPQSNAPVHCRHYLLSLAYATDYCATINVPPLPLFITTIKCQHLL